MTWDLLRTKYVFKNKNIRGVQAPLASATMNGVELREDLEQSVWNPGDDLSNFKLVEPEDFVIGLRSFQHGISYSKVRGLVSPAYTVFRAARELDSRFYKHYFRSSLLVSQLENISQGIRQGRTIDTEAFFEMPIPVPPLDEQRRIADFLNTETSHIDKLFELRSRMKALLLLKRERVIDKEIGASDSIRRSFVPLRHLIDGVGVGIVVTPASWYVESGGVPALRGMNIKPGKIDRTDLIRISDQGNALYRKSQLKAGDVVVVRTGQAGAAAVVPRDMEGANCIDLVIIRPSRKMVPEFLEYVLNSDYARGFVTKNSVGTIQSHFNVAAMKDIPVPSIPVAGQRATVSRLNEKIATIDALREQMDSQLKLLAERRQALITAAVTGQLDVTTARSRVR